MDDFAEEITLDGAPMRAVVEELTTTSEEAARQKYEGTFRRSLLLFVRELSEPPVINRRAVLERGGKSERWTVKKLISEGGMMRIEPVSYTHLRHTCASRWICSRRGA